MKEMFFLHKIPSLTVSHNFKYKYEILFFMSFPGFKEAASRLNFCVFRPFLQLFFGIIIGIILMIFNFIIGITFFVNCLTVLITGKRLKLHYDFVLRVAKWLGHLYMYFLAATDDVPDLYPKG